MKTYSPAPVGRSGKLGWLPFETLIAILMIETAVSNVLEPHRQSVPGAPDWASITISACWALGGVSILLGLWRSAPRVEMFGLLALALGITTGTTMTVLYNGPRVLFSLVTFLAVVVACVTRFRHLFEDREVVLVKVEPDD